MTARLRLLLMVIAIGGTVLLAGALWWLATVHVPPRDPEHALPASATLPLTIMTGVVLEALLLGGVVLLWLLLRRRR